jgi:MFS family permease
MTHSIAHDRSFWLICTIGFLAFVSYDLIRSPLLPLFAQDLGAGPEAIGFIVGTSTLTGIFIKFPSGTLSDHLGRSRMLLLGLSVFAIAPFFYFTIDYVWQLIALRFFHGLATGIFAPVAMAVVVDLYTVGRAEALSWYSSFTQAGRLSGRMAGGYLLLWFGFGPTFLTSAILGLLLLVLFLQIKMNSASFSTPRTSGRLSAGAMFQGMKQVVSDNRVLATSSMEAAQMLAGGALMAFLPLYGLMVGLTAGEVGLLFGIQGVSSIIAKPVMGRISDRLGRRPLIVTGQLICAAIMLIIPWTESFWMLLVLSFVFGFGEAVIGSSTSALVADLCEARSLGSAMGAFGTIMDTGHASGPIVTGLLIGLFSYRGAFAIVAALLVIVTLFFLVVVRQGEGEYR